ETTKTLFTSDLFHHTGDVAALTEGDIVGRSCAAMTQLQQGPLANYVPYTPLTKRILHGLAALKPKTLAVMHGSRFEGDGAQALYNLATGLEDCFGKAEQEIPVASST